MSRPSIPRFSLRSFCLPVLLGALAMVGCVKKDTGPTLYLYDSGSNKVVVWEDVGKVYEAAKEGKAVPDADRTLEYKEFKDRNLAWGGLAVDPNRDRLYLVSEQGKVFVILNVKDRKGNLNGKSQVTSFSLGDSGSDKFGTGSVFGQASVDPTHDVLYVMENDKEGTAARIWHIAGASKVAHNSTIPKDRCVQQTNLDRVGAGVVAAPDSKFYGLFAGGSGVSKLNNDEDATGARLRQGKSRGQKGEFQTTGANTDVNVLIGPKTKFNHAFKYGTLAYDTHHHELYVFTEPPEKEKPEILVFGEGQFHGGLHFDQQPSRTLEGAPSDLRILTHPLNSEWLLGARFSRSGSGVNGLGEGQGVLDIWKSPNEGKDTHLTVKTLPGVSRIRGIAVGGQD